MVEHWFARSIFYSTAVSSDVLLVCTRRQLASYIIVRLVTEGPSGDLNGRALHGSLGFFLLVYQNTSRPVKKDWNKSHSVDGTSTRWTWQVHGTADTVSRFRTCLWILPVLWMLTKVDVWKQLGQHGTGMQDLLDQHVSCCEGSALQLCARYYSCWIQTALCRMYFIPLTLFGT